MAGFLSKLFGGDKRSKAEIFIEEKMQTLLNKSGLKLSFDLKVSEDNKKILIDLFGEDESMAKEREGQLLDAFQLFLKRSLQNSFPDEKLGLIVDCDSFREQTDDELIDLANKLKNLVISKKKALFFRALAPRERKIVHQYLSEDSRVRTKSVGDGVYKKIKISLAGQKPKEGGNKSGETKGNRSGKPRRSRNGNQRNKKDLEISNDSMAIASEDVNGNIAEPNRSDA